MCELRPGLVNEEHEEGVLDDLVFCPDIAAKQADTAGHTAEAEIELLTVHGILHLLGYDHAEPDEHTEMFGLQDQLLAAWRARCLDQTCGCWARRQCSSSSRGSSPPSMLRCRRSPAPPPRRCWPRADGKSAVEGKRV